MLQKGRNAAAETESMLPSGFQHAPPSLSGWSRAVVGTEGGLRPFYPPRAPSSAKFAPAFLDSDSGLVCGGTVRRAESALTRSKITVCGEVAVNTSGPHATGRLSRGDPGLSVYRSAQLPPNYERLGRRSDTGPGGDPQLWCRIPGRGLPSRFHQSLMEP